MAQQWQSDIVNQVARILFHPAQFLTLVGAVMVYLSMDMQGEKFTLFFYASIALCVIGTVMAMVLIIWPRDPRANRRPASGVTASRVTKSLCLRVIGSADDDYWMRFDDAAHLVCTDDGGEVEPVKVVQLRLDIGSCCDHRLLQRKVDDSGVVWLRSVDYDARTILAGPPS